MLKVMQLNSRDVVNFKAWIAKLAKVWVEADDEEVYDYIFSYQKCETLLAIIKYDLRPPFGVKLTGLSDGVNISILNSEVNISGQLWHRIIDSINRDYKEQGIDRVIENRFDGMDGNYIK
jgi:hypothetical protein